MNEMDIVVELPVICTRGMIVFPEREISLDVGREFSLKAIDQSVNYFDENIVFISQKNPLRVTLLLSCNTWEEFSFVQRIYHWILDLPDRLCSLFSCPCRCHFKTRRVFHQECPTVRNTEKEIHATSKRFIDPVCSGAVLQLGKR